MTDLTLLDVVETALTKHGAHSILDNLNGFVSDECWLCHTPIGTIRWLRALVAENERLKGDLERYDQKDRGKTRDINLLVPEIKKAHADLAAAQSAARSMAEGILQTIDATWQATRGRDWSRPELVLAEYVSDLRATIAAAEEAAIRWTADYCGVDAADAKDVVASYRASQRPTTAPLVTGGDGCPDDEQADVPLTRTSKVL